MLSSVVHKLNHNGIVYSVIRTQAPASLYSAKRHVTHHGIRRLEPYEADDYFPDEC